jgi:predicted DNA-binding transcriptional regulator AlpA
MSYGLPVNTAPSPLIDETEVAAILGVSLRTLRRWRANGDGPPWQKLGVKWVRYPRAGVTEWQRGTARTASRPQR